MRHCERWQQLLRDLRALASAGSGGAHGRRGGTGIWPRTHAGAGASAIKQRRSASSRRRSLPCPDKLVLVRHGQSTWNLENLFTGWTDVDLTAAGLRGGTAGRARARRARACVPDVVFTSVLKRAIRTQWLMLEELDLLWLPVERTGA